MTASADPKPATGAFEVVSPEPPSKLPVGFEPVRPAISQRSYQYTIVLANGNEYPITADEPSPRLLVEAIVASKIPKIGDDLFVFPESVVKITLPNTIQKGEVITKIDGNLEAVLWGWPPDDAVEEEEEEEEEPEPPKPLRRRPKL